MNELILLIAAHFLCDYPLQGDFLAKGKGSFKEPLYGIPWWHCLTAHAAIHAGAILLILGFWQLALVEFIIHWITDFCKCKKLIGINSDQFIHIFCKIFYIIIVPFV